VYENMFDVNGRVVIITGGAGLIGSRYALVLSEAGSHSIVADINEQAAVEIASSVGGAKAMGIGVDITKPASVKNLVSRVIGEFGRIDGLVNNAALDPKFDTVYTGEHLSSFENLPLDVWNNSLAVNLTGMFLCTQAVVPYMLEKGKGAIVNISSTYGMCGPDQRLYEKDDPKSSPTYKPVHYTVTKSAVFGFTKYLATYYGQKGIRANTLTLGGVFNNHDAEFVRRYSQRTPMGRMADRDEYCGALLFLLSDASSYMTGANLVVDGGWTAW